MTRLSPQVSVIWDDRITTEAQSPQRASQSEFFSDSWGPQRNALEHRLPEIQRKRLRFLCVFLRALCVSVVVLILVLARRRTAHPTEFRMSRTSRSGSTSNFGFWILDFGFPPAHPRTQRRKAHPTFRPRKDAEFFQTFEPKKSPWFKTSPWRLCEGGWEGGFATLRYFARPSGDIAAVANTKPQRHQVNTKEFIDPSHHGRLTSRESLRSQGSISDDPGKH